MCGEFLNYVYFILIEFVDLEKNEIDMITYEDRS